MVAAELITVTVDGQGNVSAQTADGLGPNEIGRLSDDSVDAMMIKQFARWLGLRDGRSWDERELRAFGELLHRYLFAPPSAIWRWIQGRLDRTPAGAAIQLRLAFSDGDAADLAALPWEYLHTPESPGRSGWFLGKHERLWLSRYVPAGLNEAAGDREPVLTLLPVVADPDTRLGEVKPEEVLAAIAALTPAQGFRVLDPLINTTSDTFRAAIAEQHPHVVHYIGHGKFDDDRGLGSLALHDPTGSGKVWIDENELADIVCPDPARAPWLVVLHTCEGGRADFTERFAGVGPQLIRHGVSYVVGMQYAVLPSTATTFSRTLYEALAGPDPATLPDAVRRARVALGRNPRLIGVPVLYQADTAASAIAVPATPAGPTINEFHITISGTGITARCGPTLAQATPVGRREDLPSDASLTMRSLKRFDSWLNAWNRIDRRDPSSDKIQHGLDDETFEIVGELLWNLILNNSIGDELRLLIDQSKQQRVNVFITFDDAVVPNAQASFASLRALPWEFLYVRDGSQGMFLSATANLQLARYVRLPGSVGSYRPDGSAVSVGDERLRVQFVTVIPERSKTYGYVFKDVREFWDKIKILDKIDAPEPIEGLNCTTIKGRIQGRQPPHIIHVVGLCRGSPGDPKMLLAPGTDGWGKPEALVNALTPDGTERPRLVILHLCEVEKGDASENFERLAPALIAREVPAVLALQYPMDVTGAAGIGVAFYEELAKGSFIGAAVQQSRIAMYGGEQKRDFGTPVLYLQQDGKFVVFPTRGEGTTGPVSTVAGTGSSLTAEFFRILDAGVAPWYDAKTVQEIREEFPRHSVPDDRDNLNRMFEWALKQSDARSERTAVLVELRRKLNIVPGGETNAQQAADQRHPTTAASHFVTDR